MNEGAGNQLPKRSDELVKCLLVNVVGGKGYVAVDGSVSRRYVRVANVEPFPHGVLLDVVGTVSHVEASAVLGVPKHRLKEFRLRNLQVGRQLLYDVSGSGVIVQSAKYLCAGLAIDFCRP